VLLRTCVNIPHLRKTLNPFDKREGNLPVTITVDVLLSCYAQLTIYRQTDEKMQHDIDEAVIYALIKGISKSRLWSL
jgi:hypothetical protein